MHSEQPTHRWGSFPYANPALDDRKPVNQGEFQHYTNLSLNPTSTTTHEIEKYFHNYDVSFHNEIWASAFSGKFAAGSTWHWERVFWWKGGLKTPPSDGNSQVFAQYHQSGFYSNVEGESNYLDIGGVPVPLPNRKIHHHFRPLADLLAHPNWLAYEFFDRPYTAEKAFSTTNGIECFYLRAEYEPVAIGWVHNRNAWTMNNFYLSSSVNNFLGCSPPNVEPIALGVFNEPQSPVYVTWFPTRMNSTVVPATTLEIVSSSGTITLDLTDQFGGTENNYLDTLRSDYAFIITPVPFTKSLRLPLERISKIPELV